ncbi:MAG: PTS sugar transporter subunit IIA [Candidatus Eisenbacteria bacterium]
MKIADLIDARSITIVPKAKKKLDLIKDMVEILSRTERLLSPKRVLADVIEREKEKGTGLEQGVAVPHCRSEGTESLAAAFALVPGGVDFGALDGGPSRFVFLLISPKNATTMHVQALATMARVLKQDSVQEALLAAKTPQEIEKILTEARV